MIAFMKSLWRDRRGNVLAIVAAAMPLIIGGAGLATDTIQWTLWKRQLQRAADSAAIAGVYDRTATAGSTSTAAATVSHDLGLNLHSYYGLKTGYPLVTFPANSGVKTNQVAVTVAIQRRLSFSSFFMSTAPTITASATAAAIPGGGDACVEALENNATKTGITNSGNTTIYMPDCVMHSNSPSTNSASAGGSSSVTALAIAAVGGIQQSNNWHVTSYRPYSPPLADPLASVTPDPSAMHCVSSPLAWNTNFASLPAGTNCFASLSVGSNKTLNVPANFGPIYINGGSVDFQGTFNCTGCTIVLTNNDPASNVHWNSVVQCAGGQQHHRPDKRNVQGYLHLSGPPRLRLQRLQQAERRLELPDYRRLVLSQPGTLVQRRRGRERDLHDDRRAARCLHRQQQVQGPRPVRDRGPSPEQFRGHDQVSRMSRRILKLVTDARGAAVVELALIAPVLATMMIGVVDMSNAFSRKLALEQGAQRAIEKIMQTTEDATVDATLTNEVICQVNGTNANGTCKSSPIAASNVTVSFRLECKGSGGSITTQTSTDAVAFDAFTCAGGTPNEIRYIQVAVTDKYRPLFPIHFGTFNRTDGTYHLSATAGMRTQ